MGRGFLLSLLDPWFGEKFAGFGQKAWIFRTKFSDSLLFSLFGRLSLILLALGLDCDLQLDGPRRWRWAGAPKWMVISSCQAPGPTRCNLANPARSGRKQR